MNFIWIYIILICNFFLSFLGIIFFSYSSLGIGISIGVIFFFQYGVQFFIYFVLIILVLFIIVIFVIFGDFKKLFGEGFRCYSLLVILLDWSCILFFFGLFIMIREMNVRYLEQMRSFFLIVFDVRFFKF